MPRSLRIAASAALALIVVSTGDLAYQVICKPAELLFPFAHAFDKRPARTWQRYGALFRDYSTADIAPELLAALAQVESAGNPLAHTYWRWRLTWNPFAIYAPASSAVGLYQMTDAAFADSRRFCIRRHAVVAQGCRFNGLYSRILPGDAVELAAIFLDRNVSAILAGAPRPASPRQRQDLAAVLHLCGAGPAGAFAHRGFRLAAGARCGDHDAAGYVARVAAMAQLFRRLAARPTPPARW